MKPLKVSEVNNYIKRLFAGDMILSNIEVEGEISNYKKHYSGHLYFSLKDKSGRIKCVMFRSNASKLDINLVEGENIVAKGYISIYEKSGEYQLYIKGVYKKGIGELYKQYEMLKKKLMKEGLFKDEFKKTIPTMPHKIGIVTSTTGAAVEDMLTVIKRRYPICDILIYPSLVQGDNAPLNLIRGIKYLDNREDVNLIIIGRGGGSIDELFAFNDKSLARAIFNCKTPVISAVGHETDFTISDFVADIRAATPSAAAELSVPNLKDLSENLNNKYRRLIQYNNIRSKSNENELKILSRELKYNNPLFKIRDKIQELDGVFKDIENNFKDIISSRHRTLLEIEKRLKLLNPSIALKEGSGIILNEDGILIRSIKDIDINDNLKVVMKDGSIETLVKSVEMGDEVNGD